MTDLPAVPREFRPTEAMGFAKLEFYRWLDGAGGLRSAESVGLDELARVCHTTKIRDWMQNPAFQRWFFNRNHFSMTVEALRDLAVEELKGLAFDKTGLIEPKDKLKAINMILQLSDAFPKAAAPVMIQGIPPEIQALPDVEVERQLQEAQRRLAAARPAPTPDLEDQDG